MRARKIHSPLVLVFALLLSAGWPAGTAEAQTGSTTVPALGRTNPGKCVSTTVPQPP
jgi:hypothetical protein